MDKSNSVLGTSVKMSLRNSKAVAIAFKHLFIGMFCAQRIKDTSCTYNWIFADVPLDGAFRREVHHVGGNGRIATFSSLLR